MEEEEEIMHGRALGNSLSALLFELVSGLFEDSSICVIYQYHIEARSCAIFGKISVFLWFRFVEQCAAEYYDCCMFLFIARCVSFDQLHTSRHLNL